MAALDLASLAAEFARSYGPSQDPRLDAIDGERVEAWARKLGFEIERGNGRTALRLVLAPRPYTYQVTPKYMDELAQLARDIRGREIVDMLLAGEWSPSAFDDVQLQEVEAAALRMLEFVEKRQAEHLDVAAARMNERVKRVVPDKAQAPPQPPAVATQPR